MPKRCRVAFRYIQDIAASISVLQEFDCTCHLWLSLQDLQEQDKPSNRKDLRCELTIPYPACANSDSRITIHLL